MDAPRALFVTDLDGTLIPWESDIPGRSLDALRRACEAGVAVALVTGRRRSTVRREHARLAGIRYRLACSNGAVLLGEDHERPEVVLTLDWSALLAALARPELARSRVICVTLPPPAAEGRDEEPETFVIDPAAGTWMQARSPWMADTHVAVEPGRALDRPLLHVACHVGSRQQAESLEALLREAFGPEAAVHSVRSPHGGGALAEVGPPGGKGGTVRELAARLGVPHGRTAAIGDDMNDSALLDAAAFRYAVGGSVLAARRRDAVEVGSAEEGAVADAVDRFLASLGSRDTLTGA